MNYSKEFIGLVLNRQIGYNPYISDLKNFKRETYIKAIEKMQEKADSILKVTKRLSSQLLNRNCSHNQCRTFKKEAKKPVIFRYQKNFKKTLQDFNYQLAAHNVGLYRYSVADKDKKNLDFVKKLRKNAEVTPKIKKEQCLSVTLNAFKKGYTNVTQKMILNKYKEKINKQKESEAIKSRIIQYQQKKSKSANNVFKKKPNKRITVLVEKCWKNIEQSYKQTKATEIKSILKKAEISNKENIEPKLKPVVKRVSFAVSTSESLNC